MNNHDVVESLQRYIDHRSITDSVAQGVRINKCLQEAFEQAALKEKLMAFTFNQRNGHASITVIHREGMEVSQSEVASAAGRFLADYGMQMSDISVTGNRDVFKQAYSGQDCSSAMFFDQDFSKWLHEHTKTHPAPESI